MLKKVVIAGSAAAVVLGAGTAALAASGSPATPSSSPSASSSTQHAQAKGKARAALRHALHATWVTRDGKNSTSYITHDAIRGDVTAVSANSITVKAADGVSQTYAVTSSTKVHSRAAGKGTTASISSVKAGDKALVAGTGTTSLTATQIVDVTK